MDKTKLMTGRIMVLLVVMGTHSGSCRLVSVVSGVGRSRGGRPLLGFGNTLWKGVKEAVDSEGFLGIFKGGLTASSAGICGALVFGYLASLIFRPKMKE